MEKERDFAAMVMKVMASKSGREIAAENGMWLKHPSHLNVNIKNSASVLSGGKHNKSSDREMVA